MLSRMSTIVKSKMNTLMDRAEDPRETLDYAYDKQIQMLRNVKRGVVEMVTTKRRLEMQAAKVRESITTLEGQAAQALSAGREDLARLALQRKQTALIELQGLDHQVANLELEQEKLTRSEARRRSSRHSTAPLRPRYVSGPLLEASPRRWATSHWPLSAPRTRPSSFGPGPEP